MEEAKKKELYAKMIEIAEKYQDVEIKDWRDEDKLLLMSIMDKLVEGQPRTIYTVIDDGSYMKSEEGKKKLAELRKLINEHQFTFETDLPIDTYLKPNNLTEEQLNYYTPVAANEHITVEYPDKEYVWSNDFNQYIPKVKGYITTKENK